MIEFGNITLYREKSISYRLLDTAEDDAPSEQPVLELRSNRVTIPAKTKLSTVAVVVRGQNMHGTLRMTGVVLDEIRRDANIVVDGGSVDWNGLWERKIPRYERDYNPNNWVSVHIAGDQVYSSRADNRAIAEVESLSMGADVTDDIILETTSNVVGALDDYAVEHDSQTAFVLTPGPQAHRASILERRDRKTGAFSMSVNHPTPQTPVRLSHFTGFCADMMELLTLKSFLDRVQEMAADGTLAKTGITPAQVQSARLRRKELVNGIEAFEKTNKLIYRPDRPNLA